MGFTYLGKLSFADLVAMRDVLFRQYENVNQVRTGLVQNDGAKGAINSATKRTESLLEKRERVALELQRRIDRL